MAKQKCIVVDGELRTPGGTFLAFVSPEDAESVSQFRWHKSGRYVARSFVNADKKQVLELLQRHVALRMGVSSAQLTLSTVRFDNKNPRDCRRENLVVLERKVSKLRASDADASDETLSAQLEIPEGTLNLREVTL